MKEISDELYEKLDILGLLPNDVRSSNVGNSDYSEQFIQAWTLWQAYPNLTPWDYDILKRVLRTKKGETRKSDYEKIIHNCQERIRQIDVEEKYRKGKCFLQLGEDGKFHRVPSRKPTGVLRDMLKEIKEEKEAKPKFKKGDCVVVNGYTYQITEVCDDGYVNDAQGFFTKDREDEMRLWTIEDAKDGDVLYEKDTEVVFLFKAVDCGWVETYCDFWAYRSKFEQGERQYGAISEMDVCPATAEQRDALFTSMHEAGYKWNAEELKLEKIEQKQEWNDFDTKMLARAMRAVNYFITNDDHDEANQCFDWLKTIKDRVQPRPKQEWSEEDENAIEMAIIALNDLYDEDSPDTTYGGYNLPFNKAAEKLKSLKDRYTWKPSKMQMKALAYACDGKMLYLDYLNSLYSDLKKLM